MNRVGAENLVRISSRILSLTAHVAVGACLGLMLITVRVIVPEAASRLGSRLTRRWLRMLGRILGVLVFAYGEPSTTPALYVANHISWLDIVVLADVVAADFVAKQEVRGWPLVGWLAHVGGTLFVRRADFGAARRMQEHMAQRLAAGRNLMLFPEGTTTVGDVPNPFKPRLFQAAIRAGAVVQPVAISYQGSSEFRKCVAFVGEQSLLQNLWFLLGIRSLSVTIRLMPPLVCQSASTRMLAITAWESVRQGLETAGQAISAQAA
ncbi:MAG TPA: lysophospholipid acyltransferase family protein [Gammaproteobacteria bacterium]